MALGLNERFIYDHPQTGLIVCSGLLILLLLYNAATWSNPADKPLFCLLLVPLLRILSLTLPLNHFPLIYWYLWPSIPMLAALTLVVRRLNWTWSEVGITRPNWCFQLLVASSGPVIGLIHYFILKPEPLIETLTLRQALWPALILLAATGFVEELIFRGVIQRALTEVVGGLAGLYVAALYAMLNMGYQSALNLLFVFAASLFFSWIVARTHTLLGVALAHGLANLGLFLVWPFAGIG